MKKSASNKLLRIPIRYVENQWECEYGGIVPVGPDAKAELVINSRSITDKSFLHRMTAKSSIKVLDQGTTLLAYVATKDKAKLTEEQKTYLISWESKKQEIATEHIDNRNSGDLSLIAVLIEGPTDQQGRKFETVEGGLWLLTEGPRAVGLQSTQIHLPEIITKDPVSSLNHAFTKLSETYEPWRISHTGNVYQRFLYKEKDDKWYPLEFLRNAALAMKEQEIAYQLWQDFIRRVSTSAAGNRK
jgi:hypothetical protein